MANVIVQGATGVYPLTALQQICKWSRQFNQVHAKRYHPNVHLTHLRAILTQCARWLNEYGRTTRDPKDLAFCQLVEVYATVYRHLQHSAGHRIDSTLHTINVDSTLDALVAWMVGSKDTTVAEQYDFLVVPWTGHLSTLGKHLASKRPYVPNQETVIQIGGLLAARVFEHYHEDVIVIENVELPQPDVQQELKSLAEILLCFAIKDYKQYNRSIESYVILRLAETIPYHQRAAGLRDKLPCDVHSRYYPSETNKYMSTLLDTATLCSRYLEEPPGTLHWFILFFCLLLAFARSYRVLDHQDKEHFIIVDGALLHSTDLLHRIYWNTCSEIMGLITQVNCDDGEVTSIVLHCYPTPQELIVAWVRRNCSQLHGIAINAPDVTLSPACAHFRHSRMQDVDYKPMYTLYNLGL